MTAEYCKRYQYLLTLAGLWIRLDVMTLPHYSRPGSYGQHESTRTYIPSEILMANVSAPNRDLASAWLWPSALERSIPLRVTC
jgi:hypothetical protein